MFQKETFSNILKKILLTYESIQDFANHAEIDRGYLSRQINMKLDNPPTPKILTRIANNSRNVTNYEELMEICGYIESKNDFKIAKHLTSSINILTEKLNAFNLTEDEKKQINEHIEKIRNFDKNTKIKLSDFDTYEDFSNAYFKDFKKISYFSDDRRLKSAELLIKQIDSCNSYFNNNTQLKTIKIPILGSIPAGVPIELIEDIVDYEDISEEMLTGGKEYFGLKLKGDSMYPRYLDKDTVIVLKQDNCESGEDCIVMVNGDDGTFKRVFKSDSGITLQPLNNEYQPYFYSNEDILKLPVKILGVVKQIRRDV